MKLSGLERRWFGHVLEALVPAGGSELFPWGVGDTGSAAMFEEMLMHIPVPAALGLRASIAFFEFGGPLFGLGRPGRFSGLAPARQEECLAALAKSDVYMVRQMVTLVKMIACLGYGADARVRHAIGQDQPPKYISPVQEK